MSRTEEGGHGACQRGRERANERMRGRGPGNSGVGWARRGRGTVCAGCMATAGWSGRAGCCVGSTPSVEALQHGALIRGAVGGDAGECGRVGLLEVREQGPEVLLAFVGEAPEELLELVAGEAGEGVGEAGLHGGPVEEGRAVVREAVEVERGLEPLGGCGEGVRGGLGEATHAAGDLDGVLATEPLGEFLGGLGGDGLGLAGGADVGVGGGDGLDSLPLEADGEPLGGIAIGEDFLGVRDDADTPFRACVMHDAIAELEGSGRGHEIPNCPERSPEAGQDAAAKAGID